MTDKHHMLFPDSALERSLVADSRDAVFEEMGDLLIASRQIKADQRPFLLRALRKREQLASTGIGNGVAIPHIRTSIIPPGGVAAALGVSEKGVSWGALDGRDVHIVFLIVRSDGGESDDHLEFLRWVAGLARDEDFRNFMREAQNKKAMKSLLRELGAD